MSTEPRKLHLGAKGQALFGAFFVAMVALAYALRLGMKHPHLVGAAIVLSKDELLLFTSPADRSPRWFVYGLDGQPRREWKEPALPHGIKEDDVGNLEDPRATPDAVEQAQRDLVDLAPGNARVFRGFTGPIVRFQTPPGVLVARSFGETRSAALERVRSDGTLVWSSPLTTLLGDPGFEPHVLEVCHAHLREDGKALLIVVQGLAASLARPADQVGHAS